MKIAWKISAADTRHILEFLERYADSEVVRERERRNLHRSRTTPGKSKVWRRMIGCLLSTQQRSGPGSATNRFNRLRPYPLCYRICARQADLEGFVLRELTQFGGIRRTRKVATETAVNFGRLNDGLWIEVRALMRELSEGSPTPKTEREAADFLHDNLMGFGPKQSRNLLQWLGLTRHEIPLDSRLTKWFNEFGFPLRLTAKALNDRNYYHLVLDGVQALCEKAGVYPCMLDAAIFTSFDEPR